MTKLSPKDKFLRRQQRAVDLAKEKIARKANAKERARKQNEYEQRTHKEYVDRLPYLHRSASIKAEQLPKTMSVSTTGRKIGG